MSLPTQTTLEIRVAVICENCGEPLPFESDSAEVIWVHPHRCDAKVLLALAKRDGVRVEEEFERMKRRAFLGEPAPPESNQP